MNEKGRGGGGGNRDVEGFSFLKNEMILWIKSVKR